MKKPRRNPQNAFAERTPAGFGSLPRQPRPVKAPNSLTGRRAAAHNKAYTR